MAIQNNSKVKIVGKINSIMLSVTPMSFSENRVANYDQWNLVHIPVDLYAYRNTTSRNWEIQAQLISRTVKEAEVNSKILHTVRSWLQPDFGSTGAPPEILKLSAYNDPNIDNVTCILRSYNWNYPNDVDYVYMANHKMPIIGIIGISLVEIYSANEIQKGDVWKIKGAGTDKVSNPEGFGKQYPDISTITTDYTLRSRPLLEEAPIQNPLPSGDQNNVFNNNPSPSTENILRDISTGQPYSISSISNSLPNGFGG
jgi:hypothetical protein